MADQEMRGMDRSYRNKLLREAVEDPSKLLSLEKFWKLELWPHYLRRCDDTLYGDPAGGLAFTQPAPALAAKLAETHPGVNGSDLMLLAYSYLGGAYRRADDYKGAEEAFVKARAYRDAASQKAFAEHLRRYAYLRIFQMDPACFPAIADAISIHKRGNLVNRHELGECLLCRGHAYFEFKEHGRSFDDWTAALNHLSIPKDPKPWYAALHNLAIWAVEYGNDEELRAALDNLKPAQTILSTFRYRPFAKLKMRWLIAHLDARLGALGRAELVYMEVRRGLVDLGLTFEVGWISVDLAMLYLSQGRTTELEALIRETVALFRSLKVEAKAQEALDIWRQAEDVTMDLLKTARMIFTGEAKPIPEGITA